MQVNAAGLVAHAAEVDRVGEELALAARAGETVRTDVGAYGQLCQMVPTLLNGLQQAMVDGVTAAAVSAHDTASSLRSVGAAYDTADGNAADRLRATR